MQEHLVTWSLFSSVQGCTTSCKSYITQAAAKTNLFNDDRAPLTILKNLQMVACHGELGVNHYANEPARGPSEGEEEKEGLGLSSVACLRVTSVQFLCSGNYGNSLQTGGLSFFTVTAARIWAF